MPKIRIKERDLTTNPLTGIGDQYILYVLSTEQQTNAANCSPAINENAAPRVITADDAETIETEAPTNTFLSEAMALGGKVIVAYNWEVAKNYCGDRNQYDIKFILADELPSESEEEVEQTQLKDALEIAQARKDCVVVYTKITADYTTKERESLTAGCNYIKDGLEAVSSDDKYFSDEVKTPAGKYVLTFYAPGDGLHKVNDVTHTLKAGEAYILAFLKDLNDGRASWQAAAGKTGGEIPGNYEVDGFLKESIIDRMQSRTYGSVQDTPAIAINPICNIAPWGLRIWGNRTALPNNSVENVKDSTVDQLVATSFASTRLLLCGLKKQLYQAARSCQFEQNTDVLWVNFTSQVNTLLEEMKQGYGIAGYRWYREETTERAKVSAILRIVPLEAVEDFDLTIELADALEVTEA